MKKYGKKRFGYLSITEFSDFAKGVKLSGVEMKKLWTIFRPRMSTQSLGAYEGICVIHLMFLLNRGNLTTIPKQSPEFFNQFIASRERVAVFDPSETPAFLRASQGSNQPQKMSNVSGSLKEQEMVRSSEFPMKVETILLQKPDREISEEAPRSYLNMNMNMNPAKNYEPSPHDFKDLRNYQNSQPGDPPKQSLASQAVFKNEDLVEAIPPAQFRPEMSVSGLKRNPQRERMTNAHRPEPTESLASSLGPSSQQTKLSEERKKFETELNRVLNEQKNSVERECSTREEILSQKRNSNRVVNEMIYFFEEKTKQVEEENSRLADILTFCREKCLVEIPNQISKIASEIVSDFQEQREHVCREKNLRKEDVEESIEILRDTMDEIEGIFRRQVGVELNLETDWRRNMKIIVGEVFKEAGVEEGVHACVQQIQELKQSEFRLERALQCAKTGKIVERMEEDKGTNMKISKNDDMFEVNKKAGYSEKFKSELKIENDFEEVDVDDLGQSRGGVQNENYLEDRREEENARKREESEAKRDSKICVGSENLDGVDVDIEPFETEEKEKEKSCNQESEIEKKDEQLNIFEEDKVEQNEIAKSENEETLEVIAKEETARVENKENMTEVKSDFFSNSSSDSDSKSWSSEKSENRSKHEEMVCNVLKDFNVESEPVSTAKSAQKPEPVESDPKKSSEKEAHDTIKKQTALSPDFELVEKSTPKIDSAEEERREEERLANEPLLMNRGYSSSEFEDDIEPQDKSETSEKQENKETSENDSDSEDLFTVGQEKENIASDTEPKDMSGKDESKEVLGAREGPFAASEDQNGDSGHGTVKK